MCGLSEFWRLLYNCEFIDGVVVKADSRQLKYNVGKGQVHTEEFLEG